MKSNLQAIIITTVIISPFLWWLTDETYFHSLFYTSLAATSGILSCKITEWFSKRRDSNR
jgi:hypothetical protein